MERQKKILISIFALLCVVQAFFIYKRVHNYPFMIYDMYSRKEQPKKYSNIYTIVADNDTLNLVKMPILQEGMIVNSLKNYEYLLTHNENYWDNALSSRQLRLGKRFTKRSDKLLRTSQEELKDYPIWLKKYIEDQVVDKPIEQLKVYATTLDHTFGFNYKEQIIIDVE